MTGMERGCFFIITFFVITFFFLFFGIDVRGMWRCCCRERILFSLAGRD
jgi:hypothetical protein